MEYDVKSPSLCVSAQLVAPEPRTSVHREGVVGGLTAGHMGRASSPSVCQPTWLLLWQARPRQDHRLGPLVGLQQGSPASLSPLEHPSFHLRPGSPHPAPQPSAPRCHRSPSFSRSALEITLLFPDSLPCCVCNRSSLGACVFSLFISLPCPQAARFQIRLLRGSGFRWRENCFQGTNPRKAFFTVTALMWCDCQSLAECPPPPRTLQHGESWRRLTGIHRVS